MVGAITSAPFAQPLAGMNAASARADRAASSIVSGAGDHLADDAVDLSRAAISFKANVAVLKTMDDMQKTLLHALDVEA